MKKFPKILAFFLLALIAGVFMILNFLHNLVVSVPSSSAQ